MQWHLVTNNCLKQTSRLGDWSFLNYCLKSLHRQFSALWIELPGSLGPPASQQTDWFKQVKKSHQHPNDFWWLLMWLKTALWAHLAVMWNQNFLEKTPKLLPFHLNVSLFNEITHLSQEFGEQIFFFCLKTIFFCLFILREALWNLLQRQVHVEIGCRFRGLKLMSRMHCYDFAMVDCDSFVTSSPIHFERHKASQPRATAITCGKTVKSISSCSYVICLSGVQEFMRMRDHKNVRKKESERVRERESRTLIWNTLLCNWTIKTNLFKNLLSFRLNNYFLLQQSWRVWRYET